MTTPTTRTVTLRPDLALTIAEAGTGRPVLILHGGGGPFTVATIAAHLADTMHTITPTHPGWNGTARPAWVTGVEDLALAYLAYLEDNNLRDVLVIGSSLGGWIGSEMALRDGAGLITGLILIDAGGINVAGESIRDVFALDARGLAEYSFHDADRFYAAPATLPAGQAARQQANMATMRAIAGDPYMHDPKLLRRLGRIQIPTLVVWGASDRIVTPAYGAAYAAAFPDARYEIIEAAGHLPQIEQPAATFALIDGYIKERKRMDAIVLERGAGRALAVGPVRLSVKEDGTHTRGVLAVAEFTIPPHAPSPLPHVHRAHEEGFYILEGEIEFAVGGETMRVGVGAWVLAPIGVPHTFRNPGETPARFLNTFTPDRYIHYFDEMAAAINTSGPLTPAQGAEIMARYDTDVVGDTARR
ncbi:MAG: alpha/beta fold hydrolase [Herpetosiphonaceae bacterium]|nr:alpha/beta fold hydrolase [Herpetosiphonaceae bacterium]